jgi:hypothetical protein
VDFLMMMMIVEKEGKERVWAEQQKKSRENMRDFLLKFTSSFIMSVCSS